MADSVKIIAPSGGDYTSLSAWEAGEQAAGFTGVDNVVAEIQGDWSGGKDTTAVLISGWTGNTTAHRFIIRCDAANYFDGAWDESKYVLRVSGTCLRTDEDWVEVKGLQIDGVGSAAVVRPQVGVASTDTVWFDDCVIRQRAATTAAVLSTTSSTVQAVFRNSLIIHLRTSSGAVYSDGSGGVCRWKFYNCTLVHKGGTGASGVAFAFEAGNNNQAAIVRNCAIVGCASITTGGTGLSTTCNYNITDHPSTATGGANDQTGVDFSSTFTDPSNDDYTLQASDAVLKDQGEDLSGVDSGFSDDVHGQTRSGSWDVGFDEVVTSGVTGDASLTTGGATTSSDGSVAIAGSSTPTTGNATVSSDGSIAIQGASSQTTGNASSSSDGSVAIQGSSSQTTGNATVSSAGSVAVQGSSALTTGDAALASAGSVSVVANSSLTTGDATLSSSGGAGAIIGDASLTTGDATLSSSGVVPVQGASSLNANDATLSSATVVTVVGNSSVTTGDATTSSSGAVAVVANASLTTGNATLVASSGQTSTGDADLTTGNATVVSAGQISVVGTATLNTNDASVASAGLATITGSAALTGANSTVASQAVLPIVANASLTTGSATLSSSNLSYSVVYRLGNNRVRPQSVRAKLISSPQVRAKILSP